MRRMLIKELGKVITGNTPSMKNTEFYNSNDIGFVKPDIFENSRITHINSTNSFISEKARNKARIVKKDTVLITCIGSIGKVGIIEGAEYSFNQQINAIEPNDKVVAKYLAYNILSNKNRLMDIANAPVVPIINKTQFENFDIVINENIEEQKRIVKVLDQTNKIITLRRNQLNELDKLIKSRFVEMFGEPDTNEKQWNKLSFGDICKVRQGLQIPISMRLTEKLDNCYKYLTVAYLNGKKVDEYIQNPKVNVICKKDDILMTRTGNTGMVITNVEGVFHNNFFLIDFDRTRYNKTFLYHYLNLDYIQSDLIKRAGTSTIPDLNHGEFYKIVIYEPPIMLQNNFDQFVQQIDKLKFRVQQSLNETQKLFDSLMQEYFG